MQVIILINIWNDKNQCKDYLHYSCNLLKFDESIRTFKRFIFKVLLHAKYYSTFPSVSVGGGGLATNQKEAAANQK